MCRACESKDQTLKKIGTLHFSDMWGLSITAQASMHWKPAWRQVSQQLLRNTAPFLCAARRAIACTVPFLGTRRRNDKSTVKPPMQVWTRKTRPSVRDAHNKLERSKGMIQLGKESLGWGLDIFDTPVTVTPQQKISKTLTSSKIPEKYLTFIFGEITFTFGEITLLLGNNVYFWGYNEDFRVFGISLFVAGGGGGLLRGLAAILFISLRCARPLLTGNFARKGFGHFGVVFWVNLFLVQLCCLLLHSRSLKTGSLFGTTSKFWPNSCEGQITHLICARLKYDLYDFFRGCFGPASCSFSCRKGPKIPPKKVI